MGNLANAETPGYQRKTVRFEDMLQSALARLGGLQPGELPRAVEAMGRAAATRSG